MPRNSIEWSIRHDVVVQAKVKISLKSGHVPIKIESDKILLRSGTCCTFLDGYCLEDGHTFRKPYPQSPWKFDLYNVLYEGIATRMTKTITNKSPSTPVVYRLATQEITFALTKTGEEIQKHPKLFILKTTKERTFVAVKKLPVENLDIFTYINSKFVYVEKYLKRQITTLYQDVITQKYF